MNSTGYVHQSNTKDDFGISGNDKNYKEVGGWLRFFCWILCFFKPSIELRYIIFKVGVTGESSDILYFPEILLNIDGLTGVLLIAFSVYAGFSLSYLKPNAVNKAKAFLFTNLFIAILKLILIPFCGYTDEKASLHFYFSIFEIISAYSYFVIWFPYLKLSRRVRNSYIYAEKEFTTIL